jgi:NADH-quinone oxidoreductase subunit H
MAAVATTLFFGGWQVPFVSPETWAAAKGTGLLPALPWWGLQILSMVVMAAKTLVVLNVIVWVRWTLPRIRIDQMMNLCWKYLVPWAFVTFIFTLGWQVLAARVPALGQVTGVVLCVLFAGLAFLFGRQVRANITAVGDRVDMSNW